MPAITGIIGAGSQQESGQLLQRMVRSVVHEPFYVEGTYVNEGMGIWVGWANIKGSFSDGLPVWNERKDVCLVLTGEDFRDRDEIIRLKARGHDFDEKNASYLVHFYEELGEKALEEINGRLSGLIIDLPRQKAVLFNDRYGLNRIYFHEKPGSLFFSSEAKALLTVLPELRQINPRALAETCSLGCVIQNKSLYRGLSLLPGGSAWTFRKGDVPKKERYFDSRSLERPDPLSPSEYYRELKNTWIRILPRYLRGPERVALSLTGGKDSRMILAWAQCPPGSLPCYTFSGTYRECHDVKVARRLADACEQPHQVIRVGETFLKEFPHYAARTVYLTDGTMDVSGSPGLYVNALARHIAPVRLTGNYGQEILRSAIDFRPGQPCVKILDPEFLRLVGQAAQGYHQELDGHRLSFVAFKQVPWYHYSRLASELSQVALRSPYLDNEILNVAFRAPQGLDQRNDLQLRLTAEGNPALANIETDRGLLLEPQLPFWKIRRRLRNWGVKAEYAYDYGMPQPLARMDGLLKGWHLERLFLGRNKYYHFRVWYRDRLAEYIKETLLDRRALNRAFLRGRQVEALVNSHVRGTANHTLELHWLLTTELIHRQFIDTAE